MDFRSREINRRTQELKEAKTDSGEVRKLQALINYVRHFPEAIYSEPCATQIASLSRAPKDYSWNLSGLNGPIAEVTVNHDGELENFGALRETGLHELAGATLDIVETGLILYRDEGNHDSFASSGYFIPFKSLAANPVLDLLPKRTR